MLDLQGFSISMSSITQIIFCQKIAQKSDDFSSHELADFNMVVKIDAREDNKNIVMKKLDSSSRESLKTVER